MRRMTPLRTEDRPKFFRDRPGWMGYPEWKMPSGLYKVVRPEGVFRFGISQSPRPAIISQKAGMQRLFRGRRYLSGLYADSTFRTEYFYLISRQAIP